MIIIPFECGPVETMGYLVYDDASHEGVIIDTPPESASVIGLAIEQRGVRIHDILITHGHWDHVGEARLLASRFGASVRIHQEDAGQLRAPSTFGYPMPAGVSGMEPDGYLQDGETIRSAGFALDVLHVPGHSPGHVCLYERDRRILFSGDVLFYGSIGRTDLPGGSYDALMENIRHRLLTLPDDVTVYPGHGPTTTIGRERLRNPFIREYLEHFDDAEDMDSHDRG